MSKTYKVSINDGKGEEAKTVDVKQGSGANGTPTKLTGVRGYRYELQDDAKGSKLAPDQVRVKRVGKNLHVLFDGSKEADLIIEDYYAEGKEGDNGSPMLVGQAENSGMYEYVPQDPALSSTTTQLKDGAEAVAISLGGGPLPADFVLAGLPVAAAGGIGGWLAGGAAVAAGAAAGGAGGGAAVVPSGQTGFLLHTVENDTGTSEKDSITNKPAVTYTGVAERGAAVEVTVNGVVYKTTASTVDGTYSVNLEPLEEGVYTPTIKVSNAAGSSTVNGTPFTIDLSTFEEDSKDPNKLGIKINIDTDDNLDGFIKKEELDATDGKVKATVALSSDTAVGDEVVVTATGNKPQTFIVTEAQKSAGKITVEGLDAPAENGDIKVTASIQDKAGNGPVVVEDTAKLDTVAPTPDDTQLSVNKIAVDDVINAAEADAEKTTISGKATGEFRSGDTVTLKLGTDVIGTGTVNAAGEYSIEVVTTKLTSASSKVVTATLVATDGSGNPGTIEATHSYTVDTTVPNGGKAPKVEIVTDSIPTTDGGDQWVNSNDLNGSELKDVTKFRAKVTFDPEKVAIGDIVVFNGVTTTNGADINTPIEVKVTSTDLTNGFVTTEFDAPAKGKKLSVTAFIKDSGGNVTLTSAADFASLNELTAVADTNAVMASANGNTTVKIEGNVITGSSGGAGQDIEHQYSGSDVFITGVKKGTDNSTSFNSLTGVNGGTVEAEFGTLTIRANGSYDYVLDNSNAKTKALIEGQKVTETFTYKVKDAGGNESETTLSIEVTGVNDPATVTFVAGSKYQISWSLIGIDTDKNDVVINDDDAGQAKFEGVSTVSAPSPFELKFGSLTLNPVGSENENTRKGYAVSYKLNDAGKADMADTLRHDLFTLKSSDGTWSETLDFEIGATGTVTKQEFHTSTVDGLKVMAALTSTTDTLVIDGDQLTFDFSAPGTNMDSIEKINISGKSASAANTIKLSLASLTQADQVSGVHRLIIDGDLNDKVQLTSDFGTTANTAQPTPGSGYNIYHIGTDELWVNSAISNSNITFV